MNNREFFQEMRHVGDGIEKTALVGPSYTKGGLRLYGKDTSALRNSLGKAFGKNSRSTKLYREGKALMAQEGKIPEKAFAKKRDSIIRRASGYHKLIEQRDYLRRQKAERTQAAIKRANAGNTSIRAEAPAATPPKTPPPTYIPQPKGAGRKEVKQLPIDVKQKKGPGNRKGRRGGGGEEYDDFGSEYGPAIGVAGGGLGLTGLALALKRKHKND